MARAKANMVAWILCCAATAGEQTAITAPADVAKSSSSLAMGSLTSIGVAGAGGFKLCSTPCFGMYMWASGCARGDGSAAVAGFTEVAVS